MLNWAPALDWSIERWREEEEQWRGQDTGGRRRERDSLTDSIRKEGQGWGDSFFLTHI